MLGGDISKHEFIDNELVEMFMGIPLATCVELDFNNDLIDTLDADEQAPPIVDLVMKNPCINIVSFYGAQLSWLWLCPCY